MLGSVLSCTAAAFNSCYPTEEEAMKKTPGTTAADREAYWTGLIEEARRYPDGITAFCRDKGIEKNNYYSWFKRLRKSHPEWKDLNGDPTYNLRKTKSARRKKQAEPEVIAKAQRRYFTAKEKARILREIDAAPAGQAAAILRREGIYTSHVRKWRAQSTEEALEPRKRGPKVDVQAARIKELEKKTAKLEKQLHHANLLLDLQKKVAEILGTRLPESES
jgi:transposase